MSKLEERVEALRKKYGAKAVDNAARLDSRGFPELIEFRDELDPHYTKLWLDFVYGGLYARGVLDERTRHLVVIAQFIAQDDTEMVESAMRSALEHGVDAARDPRSHVPDDGIRRLSERRPRDAHPAQAPHRAWPHGRDHEDASLRSKAATPSARSSASAARGACPTSSGRGARR